MRLLYVLIASLACFLATTMSFAAESDVGIVLLHGKWDRPPTHITVLVHVLESKGFKVDTPTMPWSGLRNYDADYPAALAEIEASAKILRKKGAKRIIIGGHSFGANAAIAYAASGREVDGIMAIAPGHTPDQGRFRNAVQNSFAKAKKMVIEGKSDEMAGFDDFNQGKTKDIRTTAKIYLSYFDPEGMGSMPLSAARIPRPIPFLWVIETSNGLLAKGEDYAFNKVPKHPGNRYFVIDSDHLNTPTAAAGQIVEWVSSLGY